ncbi:MAG: hypothetical protein HY268_19745 [Deltaproteobacteria bacterium]|nr:hypothetical protein [Deltaproteobacteria bacterium]
MGLWSFYLLRIELPTARELGEQILSLAQNTQDSSLLLEAHRVLGASSYWLGEFALARTHLEQAIALYDPQQHSSHRFLYWDDPGLVSLSYAAMTLWHLGYPDQALRRSREALALVRDLSYPFSQATVLSLAAICHQYRREESITQAQAEEAITLSTEHGFPLWEAMGTTLRGWALAKQGQGEEGIAQIRQGLADWQATGIELARPYFFALLAEALEKKRQPEEGLAALAEALALVDKMGGSCNEAELYRLKGELSLKSEVRSPKSEV